MRRNRLCRLYYPNHTFCGSDHKPVQYQWLPRRLLLVRHGESEANVDRAVYSNTPDWRIPLTQHGREQALDCGRRLRRIIKDEKLYIYYSPYVRTRQTLEEIRKSLSDNQIQGEREDERLREQEMGNYQPLDTMDDLWNSRNQFSRLYYRFPFGESSADVGDRVSGFFDSLLRERIGLTVPNMNEGPVRDAAEEVAWLGMGRWSGVHSPSPDFSSQHGRGGGNGSGGSPRDVPLTPGLSESEAERSGDTTHEGTRRSEEDSDGPATPTKAVEEGVADDAAGSSLPRPVTDLGDAADRGVLPPNDLGAAAGEDQNVVIVSHGLLIRLFIGRWFRVPMEVFETMANPPNCAIVVLERNDAIGRLVMTDISKNLFGSDPLLQMMSFDGREDTQWYRERFLGIIDPDRYAPDRPAEDDDENHYSKSAAPRRKHSPATLAEAQEAVTPPPSPPPPTTTSSGGSKAGPAAAATGHADGASTDSGGSIDKRKRRVLGTVATESAVSEEERQRLAHFLGTGIW